tara:strand:+ start:1453 stop:2601 length:1149 start_codon:yes stop_codon:yes gene_type:complete
MNDYLNHKWRKFINEDKKSAHRSVLSEAPKKKGIQVSKGQKVLPYPQFRITDDFGKYDTKSRADAEMFFKQIGGTTLGEKLENVNTFITAAADTKANLSIKQILGNLVFLDVLSSIVYKFDASSAGYLLEPFLAAVYGGAGKQVKTQTGGIEDIWDFAGDYVSLKLLAGGGIHGSLNDLRYSIEERGSPMRYIVVEKEGGQKPTKLVFYEFTLGTDGRAWDWITRKGWQQYKEGNPWIDTIPRTAGLKGTFIADKYVKVANPPKERHTLGHTYNKDLRGPWYAGASAPQFNIPWKQATDDSHLIGEIDFGGDAFLRKMADQYAERLEGAVSNIYTGLQELNDSINRFLMEGDSGTPALAAADKVKDSTSCLVDKTGCPTPKK